jgi:putative membrane protein
MKRFTLLPLALAVAASLNVVAAGNSSETKTYPATGGTAAAMSANSSSRENRESHATGSNTSAGSMNGATLSTTPADRTQVAANAGAGPLSAADRDFLMEANQAGMLEVEASKLAKERASSSAVREFADMMVNDHGKAGEELKQLAAAEGVALPDTLDAKHQAKLDRLSRAQGASFDKAYAQTVGTPAHKEAVALFDKTAKTAKDADVKAFAQKTLPTLKQHLAHAQQLDKR